MTNKQKKVSKPLHKFIATGGKPKNYQGSQGINEKTVPNIKKK